MFLNFENNYFLLIIILFILIIFSNKNLLSTLNYIFYIIISLIFFIYLSDYFFDFLYFTNWKLIFLTLITISYIYLLSLIKDSRQEMYFLFYIVWLGSSIIILSNHFLLTYIGLELQTFSLFVLIAKNRFNIKSSEAGLKYFVLGALSSGFFLITISSLYGIYHTLIITEIDFLNNQDYLLLLISILLVLSLFFKLALFPLHFWIADIYEGSSSEILGILATLPKISIISLLIQLNLSFEFLIWSALGSIIIGALGGLNQTKIKRLLGYSGISHMGFVLLGLSLFKFNSYEVSTLYLTIYIITVLGLISLLINETLNRNKYISDLSGLGLRNNTLGLTWSLLLLSVAGIPPLCGFLSKWWILWSIVSQGFIVLTIFIVLFSAIAIGYYLRITKIVYFQPKSSYMIWNSSLNNKPINYLNILFLGLIFYFNLILIINPDFIVEITNYGFINLI